MANEKVGYLNILAGVIIILFAIFVFPILPGEVLITAGLLVSVAIIVTGLVLLHDFFKQDLENLVKAIVLIAAILSILFGIILLVIVLGASDEVIVTILNIFTIALIVVGLERLIGGIRSDTDSRALKIITIVIGILIAVFALITIFIPVDLGFLGLIPGNNNVLVDLLALDILLIGVSRILKGFEVKQVTQG